jgi:glutamine cyclotransferase
LTDGSNVIFEGYFENEKLVITQQHPFYIKDQNGVRRQLNKINEIEVVRGNIFANIWLSNDIYELDLDTDEVVR